MPTYNEIEKLRYDKQQTVLSGNGCKSNPHKYAELQDTANIDTIVMCPFCLSQYPLYRFEKYGNLRKCLTCKNEMMLRTLTRTMNIEEFARWVFEYRLSGFWNKVYPSFKEWNKRLKELGLYYEFWENYKRLKGNSQNDEDYE